MPRFYTPFPDLTPSYAKALQLMDDSNTSEALTQLLQEPADSRCYPFAQGNAAMILLERGDAKRAGELAYSAITHFDKHGCSYTPSCVQFLRTLADAHAEQGHYAQSHDWVEEVCTIADELCKDQPHLAEATQTEKAHALVSWGKSLFKLRQYREAINRYEQAREIYHKYPSGNRAGVPQALTNLAVAAAQVDDLYRADLALREAKEVAETQRDSDQVHRILVCAVQIGSGIVEEEKRFGVLVDAAEAAAREGHLPTAIRRFAIAAQYKLDKGNAAERMGLIERAKELARGVPGNLPDKCKLYETEAQIRDERGDSPGDILPCLLEGARAWHRLYAQNLHQLDAYNLGRDIHFHFRRTADVLMRMGRADEALVAFEAGRALAHIRQVDPAFLDEFLKQELFPPDAVRVDVTMLRRLQATLSPGQVVIACINIPREFVFYAIRKDSISPARFHIADTQEETNKLSRGLVETRYELEKGRGRDAISAPAKEMAKVICGLAEKDVIHRFVPYGPLHAVPWRVLLKETGLSWEQVGFATTYALLPLAVSLAAPDLTKGNVVCLGFDPDEHSAFIEEPQQVAAIFGNRGKFVERCTEQNVRTALENATILDLSCHGGAQDPHADVELVLRLADPGNPYRDVPLLLFCPERVNPALVILSACYSGVYNMSVGDFPVGGAPVLLQRGVRFCVAMRFKVSANFARDFVSKWRS
ncbi:MAG: CHAT domain-containing protein [Isosphaeraceae bacterium]